MGLCAARNVFLTDISMQKIDPSKVLLSDIQRRMLFDVQTSQQSALYVVQMIFNIKSAIDVEHFKASYLALFEKYPLLRACIVNDTHMSIQENVTPLVFYQDLSLYGKNAAKEVLENFIEQDANTPIDLNVAPLMRLSIFKLSKKHYTVIWSRHHIILDGRSVYQLVDTWFSDYLCQESPSVLPVSDCLRILATANKQPKDDASNYWFEYLRGVYDSSNQLPTQMAFSNEELVTVDLESLVLDKKELSQLNKYCKKVGLGLGSLLQAAWALTLANYSSSNRVLIGFVRAYPRELTEDCVGLFMNTLPVFIDFERHSELGDLFLSIKNHSSKMREYVVTPWTEIRQAAKCDMALSSVLDFKPYSLNSLVKSKYKKLKCDIEFNLSTPYSTVLEVSCKSQGLVLELRYHQNEYKSSYIRRVLSYCRFILLELCRRELNTKISDLPRLTPDEHIRLCKLHGKGAHTKVLPKQAIHKLFEAIVDSYPDQLALIYNHQQLTYKQLNQRVNRLVCSLKARRDFSVAQPVALYLYPDIDAITAILAVLKMGAAYCPIDINYPDERVRSMLNDLSPSLVLTVDGLIASLDGVFDAENCLSLDKIDLSDESNLSAENPIGSVPRDGLAYVIYTSGTTGKPKGVMVGQRALINMAMGCADQLAIDQNSRILQIASMGFDVFVAEWSMSLLRGATLCLMDKTPFSPAAIADAIDAYKVTAIILAGSILCALPKRELPSLKAIAPGGEVCDPEALVFWMQRARIVNIYGITEAAVCSSSKELEFDADVLTSNIGRPLPNVFFYLLDEYKKPVPHGVAGEIYIGGEGLAKGYWKNKDLSKASFLCLNLLGIRKPVRLYKTGDRARLLENGDFQFLGRIDSQLKVRGNRVEPLAIESVMEAHPLIKRSCVVKAKAADFDYLVCYIQVVDNQFLSAQDISVYLRGKLPAYMVPHHFENLDLLPLTAHGKVNRKLLSERPIELVEPRDENVEGTYEVLILKCIRRLTHVQEIDRTASFFALGLDSLSIAKLAQSLGLSVVDLFAYTTVRSLASYMEKANLPVLEKDLLSD